MTTVYTDTIVEHLRDYRAMLQPLIRKAQEIGFAIFMKLGDDEFEMRPYIDVMDFDAMRVYARRCARPAEGSLQIRLKGRLLTDTSYDQSGHSDIDLVLFKGSARDFFREMPALIRQIRETLVTNFDQQTVFDLIDFGADYLETTAYPFSYTMYAFDKPIFDVRLDGKLLVARILDPVVQVRLALFFLRGADMMALSFRNPFDILAMLDLAQHSIRHLAAAYEMRGIRAELIGLGQKLVSCGAGVRPNLMTDRFGPTALHLDAIFKILSSALAGEKDSGGR
ncbi:hypothetical protein K8I61_14090 [bacterium]|nr:hypothetical protein [bacterium]